MSERLVLMFEMTANHKHNEKILEIAYVDRRFVLIPIMVFTLANEVFKPLISFFNLKKKNISFCENRKNNLYLHPLTRKTTFLFSSVG